MLQTITHLFDERTTSLKPRVIGIFGILALMNISAWIWAIFAFHDKPVLLGIALVVYGLGLRHAVDADHIAAIDNVTRKFMQENKRPVSLGFFFALGHSAVVILIVVAVASAALMLANFGPLQNAGNVIGTSVSALFLFVIAAMNIVIFASIYRSYRRVRGGGSYVAEDVDILLNSRGLLSRFFRPMFGLIGRSWHMFPLGFLFGLGFDTATEVATFGLSAAQAAKGLSLLSVLVFPVLFAAAMSLVDTADGVMMLGAYNWALVKPIRKLCYNMTITLVSVLVAVLIGGIEALGLIGDKLALTGGFWDAVGALNQNFNSLGFIIIAVFIGAWVVSFVVYRFKRLDEFDVRPS